MPQRRRLWLPEEIEALRRHLAAGLTLGAAAKALGRPYQGVAHITSEHGLRAYALQRSQGRGVTEIAALFSVSETVIRKWLDLGLLPHTTIAARKGRAVALRIHDDHLKAFLRARTTWMEWQPAQIADPVWRALATDIRLHAPGDWLSPKEVAARLGVATSVVQHWAGAGRIPATRIGHNWYIWSGDLHTFQPPENTTERRRAASALGRARKAAA